MPSPKALPGHAALGRRHLCAFEKAQNWCLEPLPGMGHQYQGHRFQELGDIEDFPDVVQLNVLCGLESKQSKEEL